MYDFVTHKLPDIFVKDLPVQVRWALDDFLDDKQSMYHATEKFVDGDLFPRTYQALIQNLKARKRESLQTLKHAAHVHCPHIDLSSRLSEISSFLLKKELSVRAPCKAG